MKDHYTNYPRSILWLVRGGSLTVGGEEANAQPRFQASVAPFYISKMPITNLQYEAFCPDHQRPAHCSGDDDPAVNVSHREATDYCRWYATIARKPFRLPEEIEWEYACRAGTENRRFFDDDPDGPDAFMWHRGNSKNGPGPMDRKRANGFGLWGLLGGVWEWTASAYKAYPSDPDQGAESEGPFVIRGGSYLLEQETITSSLRESEQAQVRRPDLGFRIVKSFR